MTRPQTKIALIHLSIENFRILNEYINSLNLIEQNKDFPKGTMNRNIRDVLSHLHHWHLMFLNWYKVGMNGKKPAIPAEGYSWKDTSVLNKWIQEKYQNTTLENAKQMLKDSFSEIQRVIENHTTEELFEKKRYKWTGSTSLGAYLVSATSSHYNWALKLIKKVNRQAV